MIIPNNKQSYSKRKSTLSKTSSRQDRPNSAVLGVNSKTNPFPAVFFMPEVPNEQKKRIRRYSSKNRTMDEEGLKNKKDSVMITRKDKEQLYEENMGLKKEVNKLQEDYSILKGKVQASRKHNSRRFQHLQLQFQKELYWGGSKTHLISGIKHQYEKLKREYAQKCQQNKDLRRKMTESQVPELLLYINSLETENRRLVNKIAKQESVQLKTGQEKKVSEFMMFEMEEKQIKLQFELKEAKENLKNGNNKVGERDKKIQFLEKLIIQKENGEFHANQRFRRTQKQKENLVDEKQALQQKFVQFQQERNRQMNEITQHLNQKRKIQQELEQEINQKNEKISQLKDQIQILQQTITGFQNLNISQNSKIIAHSKEMKISKSTPFDSIAQHMMSHSYKLPNYSAYSAVKEEEEQEQEKEKEPKEGKKRVQQTADERFTENAQKVRKLEISEVEDIAEYVKYRMIEAHVDMATMKTFFNSKRITKSLQLSDSESINYQEGKQSDIWQDEYISMREAKLILSKYPFGLTPEDAHLLSRYIIEDAHGEYVYCDEGNQQKREVAKSIIRSLLGQYQLSTPQTKEQFDDLVRKYSSNVESALKTICPSGKVTKKKLLQLLEGLGIQTSSELKDYLIGKLAAESPNLKELKYGTVFGEKYEQQL